MASVPEERGGPLLLRRVDWVGEKVHAPIPRRNGSLGKEHGAPAALGVARLERAQPPSVRGIRLERKGAHVVARRTQLPRKGLHPREIVPMRGAANVRVGFGLEELACLHAEIGSNVQEDVPATVGPAAAAGRPRLRARQRGWRAARHQSRAAPFTVCKHSPCL